MLWMLCLLNSGTLEISVEEVYHHNVMFFSFFFWKYNLYVQPIHMIQKKGLVQPQERVWRDWGKGSKKVKRQWRGRRCSPCKLPLSLASLGGKDVPMPPRLPSTILFWSQRQGSFLTRLCLTHSSLVCIQAFRREGRSPVSHFLGYLGP